MLLTFAVEVHGKHDEADNDAELDDQRGLEQVPAGLLLAFREASIGAVRGAIAVEGLDNARDGSEGGKNTPGMYWGTVRDIVEYSPKDDIVCKLVEWPVIVSQYRDHVNTLR